MIITNAPVATFFSSSQKIMYRFRPMGKNSRRIRTLKSLYMSLSPARTTNT
uniref:Uncharacterized protein n=1 Tax=Anguilla anguilla TaxID=7936 RepID=A0A0E9QBC0_ANGAN